MARDRNRSRAFWPLMKLLLAVALLAWIGHRVGWTTVLDELRGLERLFWAAAAGLLITSALVTMLRWHVLMRAVGIPSTPRLAIRLGFLGLLFNNVLPGLTSGDVVKAIAVCRTAPHLKSLAFASIVVDRLVGLFTLLLVAALSLPFDWGRYSAAALALYVSLGGAILGFLLARSLSGTSWVRDLSRSGWRGIFSRLLSAVMAYSGQPRALLGALLLSLVGHGLTLTALGTLGHALGPATEGASTSLASLPASAYAAAGPIALAISALPLAPGGWGVGEAAFAFVFAQFGVPQAQSMALSLAYRITGMLISLLGLFSLRAARSPADGPVCWEALPPATSAERAP